MNKNSERNKTCLVSYSTKEYPLMKPDLRSMGIFTGKQKVRIADEWHTSRGDWITNFDSAILAKLVYDIFILHKRTFIRNEA
jgi:hypothetical protein